MARYNFNTNRRYAAKLVRVARRPIENDSSIGLSLLRLEFAIYWMFEEQKLLESQGEFACRDIVIGEQVWVERDSGISTYASALGVPAPTNAVSSWNKVADLGRFIELQFGPSELEGDRNPFAHINAFNPAGWTVKEYRFDRTAEWVTIGIAADAVGVSESTVRRRVDTLEAEWGARLIVRTEGTHRRIYLPLFMNVWSEAK